MCRTIFPFVLLMLSKDATFEIFGNGESTELLVEAGRLIV